MQKLAFTVVLLLSALPARAQQVPNPMSKDATNAVIPFVLNSTVPQANIAKFHYGTQPVAEYSLWNYLQPATVLIAASI